MKRELKIRLERFGRTVIGEVIDMDESEIGKGTLIEMPNNKIITTLYSDEFPEFGLSDVLYVRGNNRHHNKDEFYKTYLTVEKADEAMQDILRLVEEYNKQLNKPKWEESEEYKKQVEMNNLLMDMRKWQFENDEKVDPTNVKSLYWVYIDLVDYVKIKIDYSKIYRDIGIVYFSSREKAEECAKVFSDRIKEIYSK